MPISSAEKQKRFRARHPDRCKASGKAWRDANKEYNRERQRQYQLRKYGITQEDYERLLEAQGGVCAVCLTDNPDLRWGKYYSIDHCHATGKVRGLLCNACNRGIGLLRDNPTVCLAAYTYLTKS